MFDLAELPIPIVQAPMAGGPSTPELVSAVSGAGGLGFLAGGYLTAAAMRAQVDAVRARTRKPFGVNLFVPGTPSAEVPLDAYRAELAAGPYSRDAQPGEPDPYDDDHWPEKVAELCARPVPVVSFTFGIPGPADLDALRRAGSLLVVTVTSPAEARAAVDAGADVLCVQGPEAGGHRGTHQVTDEPGETPLSTLLAELRAHIRLPLIAAGGLGTGREIAGALKAGAMAVQLGTAYLRANEAGTKQPHKDALADPGFERTVVTRAFTGRPARGLHNGFIETHGATAPAAYPQLHHLTAPLRAAAALRERRRPPAGNGTDRWTPRGDPDGMSLWAGTGYRKARAEPAATITRDLWREAQSA